MTVCNVRSCSNKATETYHLFLRRPFLQHVYCLVWIYNIGVYIKSRGKKKVNTGLRVFEKQPTSHVRPSHGLPHWSDLEVGSVASLILLTCPDLMRFLNGRFIM